MNWAPLWLAFQFLTRIPIPFEFDRSPANMGQSLLYYPLVGLVIGTILMCVANIVSLPPLPSAIIVLVIWVMLSGGLHLDGLADSADAWVGGLNSREHTLEIMKDPRAGPMAITTVVLLLLTKFAALSVLVLQLQWTSLLFVPVLGRLSVIALYLTTPYARSGGMGDVLVKNLPRKPAYGLLAIVPVIIVASAGLAGLAYCVSAIITLFVLRFMMLRRLGGATGDTTGASIEIIEAIVLLTACWF